MARFCPKTGVFRGVLFTTKVIGLPSVLPDKFMIQDDLSRCPGLVRIPKKGVFAIFLFF
jgi:hypothetical protein